MRWSEEKKWRDFPESSKNLRDQVHAGFFLIYLVGVLLMANTAEGFTE